MRQPQPAGLRPFAAGGRPFAPGRPLPHAPLCPWSGGGSAWIALEGRTGSKRCRAPGLRQAQSRTCPAPAAFPAPPPLPRPHLTQKKKKPSLLSCSLPQGGGYAQQTAAQAQAQSESLRAFWAQQMREVQAVGTDPAEFKNHQLPLARIKKVREGKKNGREGGRERRSCPGKTRTLTPLSLFFTRTQIMKSDEDVRMISAEAPVLFARVS